MPSYEGLAPSSLQQHPRREPLLPRKAPLGATGSGSLLTAPNPKSNLDQPARQFTNRRSLTLWTRPSIRKVDSVLEPPALISGSGIPVIGMRPTTIPIFTSR